MIFPKISDIYTGHLLLCPRTELTQFSLLGRHIFFKILSQFKANTISTRGCTEDFFSEKNPSIPLKVKVLSINHFVYSTDNRLDRWFMLHKKQFDKKSGSLAWVNETWREGSIFNHWSWKKWWNGCLFIRDFYMAMCIPSALWLIWVSMVDGVWYQHWHILTYLSYTPNSIEIHWNA
jgi:hypothetical protein